MATKKQNTRNAATDALKNATINRIAFQQLGIGELRTRNSDSLDFHELGVASIKAALEAAYEAGRACGALDATAEAMRIADESKTTPVPTAEEIVAHAISLETKELTCRICDGAGTIPAECESCQGDGCDDPTCSGGHSTNETIPCPECEGAGKVTLARRPGRKTAAR